MITDYYIPAYEGTSLQRVTIVNVIKITSSLVLGNYLNGPHELYKDGIRVYDVNTFNSTVSYGNEIMQSLRISYKTRMRLLGTMYIWHTLMLGKLIDETVVRLPTLFIII